MAPKLNFALIGAGGIGKQWASGIAKTDAVRLAAVVDVDEAKAKEIAAQHEGCLAFADWHEAAAAEVDGAIVATPHNRLAEITRGFLEAGKHALCEKPAGIFPRSRRDSFGSCRICGRTRRIALSRFGAMLMRRGLGSPRSRVLLGTTASSSRRFGAPS